MTTSTARANSRQKAAAQLRVLIATPAYDHKVVGGYALSLVETVLQLERHGVAVDVLISEGESLIPRARNLFAARFLADRRTTHLMWIDADIIWNPQDVLRLIAHDLPVVCGLYPMKSVRTLEFPFQPLIGDDGSARIEPTTGCVEITNAPTGFLLIKREVFERLTEAYPASKVTIGPSDWNEIMPWLWDFFPAALEDGQLWSEDFGFCRRWRAIGGQVWMDPTIKLQHVGKHTYEGDPMTLFGPRPAATQEIAA